MECPICIYTTKSMIYCTFCEEKCCKKCLHRIFNDQESVACLYCKKEWTRKFIREKLGITYLSKEYKKFNEKKGFEYERSLLPATLLVIKERESIKKKQAEIDDVNEEIDIIRSARCKSYNMHLFNKEKLDKELNSSKLYHSKYIKQLNDIIHFGKEELVNIEKNDINIKKTKMLKLILKIKKKEKISSNKNYKLNTVDLKNKINTHVENMEKLSCEYNIDLIKLKDKRRNLLIELRNGGDVVVPDKNYTRNFIRSCPDGNCRGYLSTQWKCGLCNKHTCSKCITIKNDENHECNNDDVETAKLLKDNTKPCPKCSTGIFKIDGCDQMWCTQCHTAFSWKSGQIQTRVHNPHYYQWLRENNSNNNIQPDGNVYVCGQALTNTTYSRVNMLLSSLSKILHNYNIEKDGTTVTIIKKNTEILNELDRIFACYVLTTIHIQEILVPRFRTDDINNNLELRVKYLQNEIDEDMFKTKVQRSNKLHEKKKEIYDVLILVVTALTEIVLRMYNTLPFDFCKKIINPHNGTYNRESMYLHSKNQNDNIYIGCKYDGCIDLTDSLNECLKISKEIPELAKYTNECLNDISFSYNNSKYVLDLDINKICNYSANCTLQRSRFVRHNYTFNQNIIFRTENQKNKDYGN